MAIDDDDIGEQETWTGVPRRWYTDAMISGTGKPGLGFHAVSIPKLQYQVRETWTGAPRC